MKNKYMFIFLSVVFIFPTTKAMDDFPDQPLLGPPIYVSPNSSQSSLPNSPKLKISRPLLSPFKDPNKSNSTSTSTSTESLVSPDKIKKQEIIEIVDDFKDLGASQSEKSSPALLQSIQYYGSTDLPPEFFDTHQGSDSSDFCVVVHENQPTDRPKDTLTDSINLIDDYDPNSKNLEIPDQRVLEAIAFFNNHEYGKNELEQISRIFARSEFREAEFTECAKLLFNEQYFRLLNAWNKNLQIKAFTLELLEEENLFLMPSSLFENMVVKNIRKLHLNNTNLFTLPTHIRNLENLEIIYVLSKNKLSLPLEISNLSNLKKLEIWGGVLDDQDTKKTLEILEQRKVKIEILEPQPLMTASVIGRHENQSQSYLGTWINWGYNLKFFK